MKNTNHKPTEALKKNIDSVSQRSKESIRTMVDSTTKQFDSALEANKKTFDSMSKMLYNKEMDPSIVSSFRSTFGKGLKLSEDTIDTIIDLFTKRTDMSIDFATRFMEAVRSEDLNSKEGIEKLSELVKENLDKSIDLSMHSMEKMVSLYNEHLNLALNFNKKFSENMSSQIDAMFKIQKKSIDGFYGMDMMTEWWKTMGEEKVKA